MMTRVNRSATRWATLGAMALAIGVASVVTGDEVAAAPPQAQPRRAGVQAQQPQAAGVTYTRADAELIGRRLYRAALGRDADAGGLTTVTAEIQRGNLQSAISNLVTSAEFVRSQQSKPAAELVEQFYQGLLQRAPDTAGVRAFMPRVQRRQYATVLTEMIGSPEFRSILASPPADTMGSAATSRLDHALGCQGKVIEAARKDAGGRVFLTFDRMPEISTDGGTVSGPAVDRFGDEDRQLTYRCAGSAITYVYADRKGPVAVDPRLDFPSGAVRACEAAVRPGLIFEAASLTATDTNAEYVLGISGSTVHQCEMSATRVVSVK